MTKSGQRENVESQRGHSSPGRAVSILGGRPCPARGSDEEIHGKGPQRGRGDKPGMVRQQKEAGLAIRPRGQREETVLLGTVVMEVRSSL